jgi:hypothetical protein
LKHADQQHASELERANAELRQSLEHCRELLAECRSKLAANSNAKITNRIAEKQPGMAGGR